MDIDLAELASLVTLLKEADFTEFRYDKGNTHIVVRRGPLDVATAHAATLPAVTTAYGNASPGAHTETTVGATAAAATHNVNPPASAASATAMSTSATRPGKTVISREPVPGAHVVTAPMLGTFYAAPKPGEPAFVAIGDAVGPDAVVCIVEVMKLMNSVHADISGTIVAIHAENGELVEYGQPLFSIQASSAS